jgi:hypothetical protein
MKMSKTKEQIEKQNEWRRNNKERVNKRKREWRKNHAEQYRLERRKGSLKRIYGITLEIYNDLLKLQNGACAICSSTDHFGNKHTSNFQVDHDHKTNKIRGLLCSKCNRGLGLLGDNIENIEKVLIYLKGENEYNTAS